uniref:Uncharacterized protein n=2 Tax=Panagrolaimus davidi TaxID=227884 RepID=A0A914PJ50_9BILA
MLPSAVQAHRDSYGKRLHQSGSPTSINSNENNYYGEMKRLPLMLDGYLKFQSLRKASYALLVGGGNFKSWDPEFIPQSTYSNAKKSSQMVTSLLYDMVNEFFVPFTNFPPEDKKILFEQFSVLFDNAEKSYNTFKAYGHIENNDKVILADGGYVKLDEIYKYYINSLDVNADPQQLVK